MFFLSANRRAKLLTAALLLTIPTSQAQPVHVSAEGVGQVLIYPYYTTRSGWSTLLSIVNNDSSNGKAIKLRFLEGKNGALVGALNIFLAANDVWTGAVVSDGANGQGARLVSADKSCTYPSLRRQLQVAGSVGPSLAFNNEVYGTDADAAALRTLDRTREGFFEVIEMASIPFSAMQPSALRRQIYAYESQYFPPPPCDAITDADLSRYTTDIVAPKGGLSGSATVVNVVAGASAEYSAVAIDNFWLATPGATVNMTASTAVAPSLASGANTTAQISYGGKTYFSKFDRAIDAVSAVLMTEQLLGEHAFTKDGVIQTTWVVTQPTKRFYTQTAATAPFSAPWTATAGAACDDITLDSTDREVAPFIVPDDFSASPRPPNLGLCYVTGTLGFGLGGDYVFGSSSTYGYGYAAIQNGNVDVIIAGTEGGKTRLLPASPKAQLTSRSGNVASANAETGLVSQTTGAHTFFGLPMIGLAFTVSAFKLGNPQQNFGSGFRLQSTRRITTP